MQGQWLEMVLMKGLMGEWVITVTETGKMMDMLDITDQVKDMLAITDKVKEMLDITDRVKDKCQIFLKGWYTMYRVFSNIIN